MRSWIILLYMLCICLHCSSKSDRDDRLLHAVYATLPSGLELLTSLGRWKDSLGRYDTVMQLDGEDPTFFYWPRKGIGVVTHPLYEHQFQKGKRTDSLVVTSLLLFLHDSVSMKNLPIDPQRVLQIADPYNVSIDGKSLRQMSLEEIGAYYIYRKDIGNNEVEFSNKKGMTYCSVIHDHKTILYIEFFEHNATSHYD